MQVTFTKTGPRSYSVRAEHQGRTVMNLDPAPGFGEVIVHDIIHYLVEFECDIRGGVFGQALARAPKTDRVTPRKLRDARRRGERIRKANGDQMARSEHLVGLSLKAWRGDTLDPVRLAELGVEPADMARIRARLDEVSRRWQHLAIGDSLTLPWLDEGALPRAFT